MLNDRLILLDMKRFLTIATVLFVAALATAGAQPRHNRCCPDPEQGQGWRDRIRSERVAFLTSEMDITSEEAEKFWPVYNQLQDEKMEAQKAVMDTYRALEAAVAEGKSEKEVSSALDAYMAAVEKRHEVNEKTAEAFKEVLPVEKVAKYYVSEEKFRRNQIHRLHGDNRPGRPGPDRK